MQKRLSIALVTVAGIMVSAAIALNALSGVAVGAPAAQPAAPAATATPQPIYLPVVNGPAQGAHFVKMGAPDDLAAVDESYTSTVPVITYHEAYTVTGFSLVEEDAFGATSPQIDATGAVVWQPTAADTGVHHYVLTALVNDNSRLTQEVAIEVAPRTWLISTTVGNDGGVLVDASGDYQVVIPADAVAADRDEVTVAVSVIKRADGSVRVSRMLEGLSADATPSYTEPLYAVTSPAVTAQGATGACSDLPFITALNPDPLHWKGGEVYSVGINWHWYPIVPTPQNVDTVRLRGNVIMSYYPALPGRGMTELRGACTDNCLGKQPVLFVHGYSPFGNLGGGVDTWNCAFDYVKTLGGEPYEFRWRGNMRFEDAAYQLAQAIAHVTQLTGRKPLVVGHSMGGILITTYLAGLAEVPNATGQAYVPVGYDSPAARGGRRSAAVAGVITISSPLSGIASTAEGNQYGLPRGRDVHPTAWSILACSDFTCGQSGFSGTQLTYPGFLSDQDKVVDFQHVFSVTLSTPGAHIHRLYDAWGASRLPDLHYDVLVSAWYAPGTPDWTDEDWGDGLIAVTGMQVLPHHFVGTDAQGQPYNFIRTAGRALTVTEKQSATIPANIDYTFMLTPSLTGGFFGFPHTGLFDTYVAAWWATDFSSNPNAPSAELPQNGVLDYYGKFAHSLKPVLDRAYATAAALPPVFTNLDSMSLVINGSAQEADASYRDARPLAHAPVHILFTRDGDYRGMVQAETEADGSFTIDLGRRLGGFGISDSAGLEIYLRIGNDTTHDAATIMLGAEQLTEITNVGAIVLPRRQ